MADLSRIIDAIKCSGPRGFAETLEHGRKSDDPGSEEIIDELVDLARQSLPAVLAGGDTVAPAPPDRQQPPDQISPVVQTMVENFRALGIGLPHLLTCHNLVKKYFLQQIFDSAENSPDTRSATLLTEDFFSILSREIVTKWLGVESKKQQKQRKESRRFILRMKKRYSTIFSRMNEPAFVLDEALRFVDVNPAFTSFFGLKPRAVLGEICCSVIGSEFCASCPLEKMIKTGGSFSNVEITVGVPVPGANDSDIRTIRVAGSSLGDIEDVGMGGIVIFQDITSHKKYESALKESEEKYRSLVENLPDVTWRADRAGRLLFVSHNLEKICHLETAQLLGRDRFERVHPDDVEEVREAYALLFSSGVRFDIKYRFMIDIDSWIWIHDRADRVIEAGGQQVADGLFWDVSELKSIEEELDDYRCWLEDFVDERTEEILEANERLKLEISERKQVEMELIQMAASLKTSNEELEQFAHVASHDLKEPLMLINAFAERLLRRYGHFLDERGNEYLNRIVKAARQSQDLVLTLLEMSTVSTSTRVFEPLDLDEIVRDVVSDLQETINISGSTVKIELEHNLVGDPVQIRQLFQNMLANSIKYRREDIPLLVNIRSRLIEKGLCEITIKDNGIGFTQDDASRIFDPFVRLHAKGKYEGSGMGLATCKKIVQRHGGNVFAECGEDGGALFIIHLPTDHQL